MKTTHRLSLVLALALTAATPFSAPCRAQEGKVKPEDASAHFESVAKHLELGGVFYAYADIDGDIKKLTETIDQFLSVAREQSNGEIPEKLTAAGIANELGLDCIKAAGMSSRKNGNLFHNRAFLATPGGRAGIFKILGDKPAAFTSPKLAPAGADIVVEEDLKLSVVLEIAKNLLGQIEDEDLQEKFDEALQQPMAPLEMTVGEFIGKLDTKLTFIASVDPAVKLDIEGPPNPLPMVDAVLCLDGSGWLFDALKQVLSDMPDAEFEIKTGEDFESMELKKELPEGFEIYKPTLHHDKKNNRVLLGSRPEYIAKCLSGASTVAGDEDFKKATTGLPGEGNGLSYVSSEAMKELWKFLEVIAQEAGPPEMRGTMLKAWEMYLPKGEDPMASVRANLPDGVLFTSNSFDSHKGTLATMMSYPMMLGAMAFGTIRQQAGIEMAQQAHAEEMPEEPDANEKTTPEQKIEANLQQVAFAAEAYFLDHPKDKEVNYAQLIKGGFLFDVDPVAGETYRELSIQRAGGKVTVKTQDGKKVEFAYPATTD
ncbi:MAG: hypothetical protein KA004_09325 [Verrucomicrobiales bacterium]|nr:hypothetical protein [Verrucomicrobiales bacterium]